MFKGAQTVLARQSKETEPTLPQGVFPCLSANQLLAPEHLQQSLAKIYQLAAIDEVIYQDTYFHVICQFAEFVQQLPATPHSHYQHTGGMLEYGLERAVIALGLVRSYLQPHGHLQTDLADFELWLFAVFTAALLKDISRLVMLNQIQLCLRDGTLQRNWNPFEGSLTTQGHFYRHTPVKEHHQRLLPLINPLLARQIVDNPQAKERNGFLWLSDHLEVLETWLALLNEDQSGGGILATIVPLADAQAIQAYFMLFQDEFSLQNLPAHPQHPNFKIPLFANANQRMAIAGLNDPGLAFDNRHINPELVAMAGLPTVATAATSNVLGSITAAIPPSVVEGLAFLRWLKQQLGGLSVNQANSLIHRVSGGVVILPELLQRYLQQQGLKESWQTLANNLQQLQPDLVAGLPALQLANGQTVEGVVINNPYLVFEPGQVPASSAHLKMVQASPQPNHQK